MQSVLSQRIRVRKEDSAFIYAILESHEGICSYSTLTAPNGALYRDLELQIPEGFKEEVGVVLGQLAKQLEDPYSPQSIIFLTPKLYFD